MKAVEFCYWLQGMFELNPPTALSAEQRTCIVNHLRLVKVAEPKHTNAFVRWLDLYLPSAGSVPTWTRSSLRWRRSSSM